MKRRKFSRPTRERRDAKVESNWSGPFVVKDISEKGLATLVDKSGTILSQKTSVSQLKPFLRRDIDMNGENMKLLYIIKYCVYCIPSNQW